MHTEFEKESTGCKSVLGELNRTLKTQCFSLLGFNRLKDDDVYIIMSHTFSKFTFTFEFLHVNSQRIYDDLKL